MKGCLRPKGKSQLALCRRYRWVVVFVEGFRKGTKQKGALCAPDMKLVSGKASRCRQDNDDEDGQKKSFHGRSRRRQPMRRKQQFKNTTRL